MILIITPIIFIFEMVITCHKTLSSFVYQLFDKKAQDHASMSKELKTIKAEQSKISLQNEFAKYSKLQRKINSLTDKLTEHNKSRSMQLIQRSYTLKMALYVIYGLVMLYLFYYYKYEPVTVLPKTWFPYVNRVLMIPTGVEGAIGLPVWIFICKQLVQNVLS